MIDHLLFIEAMNAGLLGIVASVFISMLCKNTVYSWREFTVIGLLLLSVLLRFSVDGAPPVNHVPRLVLLNVIFVVISAIIWSRPSKIPAIERRNFCKIKTLLMWLRGESRRFHARP